MTDLPDQPWKAWLKNPATILAGVVIVLGLIPTIYNAIYKIPSLPEWRQMACMKIHNDKVRCGLERPPEKPAAPLAEAKPKSAAPTRAPATKPAAPKWACDDARIKVIVLPFKTNFGAQGVPKLQSHLECATFSVRMGKGAAYHGDVINGVSFSDSTITPRDLSQILRALKAVGVNITNVDAKEILVPNGQIWLLTDPNPHLAMSTDARQRLEDGVATRTEMLELANNPPDP